MSFHIVAVPWTANICTQRMCTAIGLRVQPLISVTFSVPFPSSLENAASFLRVDLPSTLVSHKTKLFEKVLKPKEFENVGYSAIRVLVFGKHLSL